MVEAEEVVGAVVEDGATDVDEAVAVSGMTVVVAGAVVLRRFARAGGLSGS